MSTTAVAPPATRWGVVLLVFALGGLTTMQLGKVPPTLSLIRVDLGISMVMAGWVASLMNLIGAIFGVAIGVLAGSLGHRRIVSYGLLCLVAGSALGGLADSGWFMLATRFLEGIGYIAIIVAGTPLIAGVCAPKDMDLAMSVWSAYFPLGVGIMILISPIFLSVFDWRAMWFANAVLATFFLIAFRALTRDIGERRAGPQDWRDVRTTLSRLGPWLLAASFIPFSVSVFAITTWMPTFLAEKLGYSPATAALLAAAFMFLFLPPGPIVGWLLKLPRVKRWHLMTIGGFALGLAPLAMMGDGVPAWGRLVAALLFSQIAGLIPGAVFAGIPAHAPNPRQIGTVAGVLIQGNFIGVLIGPPLLAIGAQALGGWEQSGVAMLAVGALGVAAALALASLEARDERRA